MLGTKCLVPSTWYHIFGTKYLVPNTWYQVPSMCYQILGTKYLVPNTWYQNLGTKYLVPNIWYQVLGTRWTQYVRIQQNLKQRFCHQSHHRQSWGQHLTIFIYSFPSRVFLASITCRFVLAPIPFLGSRKTLWARGSRAQMGPKKRIYIYIY